MHDNLVRIGPSILTANWLQLGDDLASAETAGVDYIHLDIMDGRFVPNISFGFPVVEAVRAQTRLPLDCHLMIEEPEHYVERFVEAGADVITVHVETSPHLLATLQTIERLGAIPGVTLNPGTPLSAIEEAIPYAGQVLIMSVNPGFGGQSFMPTAIDRIVRMRDLIERRNPNCVLQVDGGVKATNLKRLVDAGATSFVVGSAIFAPGQDVGESVRSLRATLG